LHAVLSMYRIAYILTTDFSTINTFRRAISDVDIAKFLVLTHDTNLSR